MMTMWWEENRREKTTIEKDKERLLPEKILNFFVSSLFDIIYYLIVITVNKVINKLISVSLKKNKTKLKNDIGFINFKFKDKNNNNKSLG